MPLARYPIYLEVTNDEGNDDDKIYTATANDGSIWTATNLKPSDSPSAWQRLPDLPQG